MVSFVGSQLVSPQSTVFPQLNFHEVQVFYLPEGFWLKKVMVSHRCWFKVGPSGDQCWNNGWMNRSPLPPASCCLLRVCIIPCTLPPHTNSDHKLDHNKKHNKLGREMHLGRSACTCSAAELEPLFLFFQNASVGKFVFWNIGDDFSRSLCPPWTICSLPHNMSA